jgi:hypothetical protein
MIDFLNEQWSFALIALGILFFANSYMSSLSGKVYESHAHEHVVFSTGDSPNPSEQKEGKANRLFSAQNIYTFLYVILLIVNRLVYGKEIFEFFYGALWLVLISSILRHMRNMFQFASMNEPNSVVGRIEYSRAYLHRVSSLSWLSQSVIFGIAALATIRSFFWGGAFLCLVLGLWELLKAKQYVLLE